MIRLRWSIVFLFCAAFALFAQQTLKDKLSQNISVNFQRATITDVLRILATQNNLNLVVGEGVQGTVSIRLNNVKLADALSMILKSRGYHYVIQKNILLVKPFETMVNGELDTRVFKLNYLDGFQLVPVLKPLLSGKGKIEALVSELMEKQEENRSDILVVSDVWENLETIERVIKEMDVEPVQIQIEVKLVETFLGGRKQVGINWPKKVNVTMTGAETTAPITKTTTSGQQPRYLSSWYELPQLNDKLTLGVLTTDELNVYLELLARDDKTRLVSNPKVVTQNNKKAVINVSTLQPVPQVSRGVGGDLVTYEDKQISMLVEVVPKVNEDGKIIMTIHPRMEEITGYVGPTDFPQPIIARREVTTNVAVDEGETVAIGGLIKTSETKVVEKVWLLGDIPLLGYFFRHTTTQKKKSDLLIFITPKILK